MRSTSTAIVDNGIPLGSIITGEREGRNLTHLALLQRSIAARGLRHPLVTGPGRQLILGMRRRECLIRLGAKTIPGDKVVEVASIGEALAYLEAENADPLHALPLSVAEAMALDGVLRGLRWWPRREPAPRGQGTGASRDTGNDRRRRLAEALGMNSKQYVNARTIWTVAHGYRDTFGIVDPVPPEMQAQAQAIFAGITTRDDIVPAWRQFEQIGLPPHPSRGRRAAEAAAARRPSPSANGRTLPRRDTVEAIRRSVSAVAGMTGGLADLDPAGLKVPASQRAQWVREITQAIRDLSSFRRQLNRER